MSLFPFNLEQTHPFPKLFYWCSVLYSHSTYILQKHKTSKLIGSLTPQSIRVVLGLTKEFFRDSIPFNELDMMYLYKSYDPVKKYNFLKLILKPKINTHNLEYPCQISIFKEEI